VAELLIKAVDAVHPDAAIDAAWSHKRGDVVAAQPDGHAWGRDEGLPGFYRVAVPDLLMAEAARLLDRDVDPADPTNVLRARAFTVRLDLLPQAARDALAATGSATISRALAAPAVMHKASGLPVF